MDVIKYSHTYNVYLIILFAEENPVGPVGFIFGGRLAVVEHWWGCIRSRWHGVGQIPQGGGHRMTAALGQSHEPGKAQGILVAWPGAIQFPIVEHDFLIHVVDEALLFQVEFLNHAGFDPNALLNRRHLRHSAHGGNARGKDWCAP